MKHGGKEIENFMDEEHEQLLIDLCSKYYALKQRFARGEFKRKVKETEVPLAAHDSNYAAKFKEIYDITLTAEEMIELRHFAENDYPDYMLGRIAEEREKGMTDIDLRDLF